MHTFDAAGFLLAPRRYCNRPPVTKTHPTFARAIFQITCPSLALTFLVSFGKKGAIQPRLPSPLPSTFFSFLFISNPSLALLAFSAGNKQRKKSKELPAYFHVCSQTVKILFWGKESGNKFCSPITTPGVLHNDHRVPLNPKHFTGTNGTGGVFRASAWGTGWKRSVILSFFFLNTIFLPLERMLFRQDVSSIRGSSNGSSQAAWEWQAKVPWENVFTRRTPRTQCFPGPPTATSERVILPEQNAVHPPPQNHSMWADL